MFIFLLSGLFCCLGFSGVIFFAVWAGACSFFAVWAGSQAPPKQQKKTTPPPKQQKQNTTRPFRACFVFCCLGGGSCFFFCCLCVCARVRCFFCCCLGGGRVLFLLFGRGACSFFAVWAGDGSSLTYPSAWLVFKRPNNKKDRTAKKTHGFHVRGKDTSHET